MPHLKLIQSRPTPGSGTTGGQSASSVEPTTKEDCPAYGKTCLKRGERITFKGNALLLVPSLIHRQTQKPAACECIRWLTIPHHPIMSGWNCWLCWERLEMSYVCWRQGGHLPDWHRVVGQHISCTACWTDWTNWQGSKDVEPHPAFTPWKVETKSDESKERKGVHIGLHSL